MCVRLRRIAQSPPRAFALIFVVATILRGGFLTVVPSEYFLVDAGWEVGAVAQSLAATGDFANPYALATGPTAHTPPIYPLLLSLIYRGFGLSNAASYVAWGSTIVIASVTLGMLPWIAPRFGLRREAGLVAGLVGALWPGWPPQVETLAALALLVLLVLFLHRWSGAAVTTMASIGLGFIAGISFHLTPSLLPVVLGALAFEGWWRARARGWRQGAIVVAAIIATCLPWTWRNYQKFGEVFFVRDNFGLELRVANFDGATVERTIIDHPRVSVAEAGRVQAMGELAYMHHARDRALAWIRSDPAAFAALTFTRMSYFWFGPLARPLTAAPMIVVTVLAAIGFRRAWPALSVPQRAIVLIPLAAYPPVYYVLNYLDRYRIPIFWILLLGAGSAIWHLAGRAEDRLATATTSEVGNSSQSGHREAGHRRRRRS